MEKYSQLRDLVSKLPKVELVEAPSATDTQILFAHDPSYLHKVIKGQLIPDEQKEIGFPWSEKWSNALGAQLAQLSLPPKQP